MNTDKKEAHKSARFLHRCVKPNLLSESGPHCDRRDKPPKKGSSSEPCEEHATSRWEAGDRGTVSNSEAAAFSPAHK